MSEKLKQQKIEILKTMWGILLKANLEIAADRGNFNKVYFCHALFTMSMGSSYLGHIALSRIPFMFSRTTTCSYRNQQ